MGAFTGSVAGRPTIALVCLGITATIVTTVIQTYQEYQAEIDLIDVRFEDVRKSHGASLAASVWHYADRQIELELQGILNTPGFEYAEIKSLQGPVWTAGSKSSSNVAVEEIPLIFRRGGKDQVLGILTIAAGKQAIYDRIILHALQSLTYFGIWTFFLAGALFLIFRQLVTRHLSALARYTSSMSFDVSAPPLVLDRAASMAGPADELEQVARAINSMQSQLAESVQKLHESERKFRRLFENAEVSIWNEDFSDVVAALDQLRNDGVRDLRGYLSENEHAAADMAKLVRVVQVNEATLNLFGAETEDKLLYRIDETFGANAIEVFKDEICAIWDGHKVFRSEAVFQTLDGQEINAIITFQIPETKEGFKNVPVSIIDITDRKVLEEQVRRAQKMEAVGQLTGGIAHDFNNILAIITGNLELLRLRVMQNPDVLKFADAALSGTKRGADITRKLLVFSGQRSGDSELIVVNESITRMQEFIAKSLTAAIDIKTRLAADLWPVEISPGDFEDAILNLALNARDAMPDGGSLTIETVNKVLNDLFVRNNPSASVGEFVMIAVSDNGAGMSAEVQEKVFDPFFSTKETGKGTGLGLSMVYGFVQRSGGHIMVNSEPGSGTTFRIFLPRASSAETIPEELADHRTPLPRGSETILIVDDEKPLLDIAAAQLDDLGYNTLTVDSGVKALEILANRPDIDLMFCDIIMPGDLDGYQLALAAHETYPKLKILLTSGFTKERETFTEAESRYLSELARNLLRKPYDVEALASSVRRALDG
ncbi:MAG: ATP-binding protein [Alphaproteobacteria bacterium]|nr:ATP-binding protein [Alphaproteobacteria bacterium]